MKEVFFEEIFEYKKKSKVKAGDGLKLNEGTYPFFTSSNTLSKSMEEFLFEKPSLIFGTGGMPSIHFCDEKFSVSTDCLVAQPRNEASLHIPYIYYFFSMNNMRILQDGFKGAGLKHISRKYIDKIKIPLPPIKTQQRIASILDDAAALRDKTAQLLTEYDLLAQSIFLEMFGDPVKNSKDWAISYFSKILYKIDSGWSPVCENTSRENILHWAILKLGSTSYGFYNQNENKRLLEEVPNSKLNCEVEKGDLLFTRKNTHHMVGVTAFVFETEPNLIIPDTVFRLKYNTDLANPIFLYYLLNHRNYSKEIRRMASGSAASMPNISKAKLMSKSLICPPIELQNQFADKITLIEQQKALAKKELQESEDLFNCLLQEAFKGELV